jgi:hypothetical protein
MEATGTKIFTPLNNHILSLNSFFKKIRLAQKFYVNNSDTTFQEPQQTVQLLLLCARGRIHEVLSFATEITSNSNIMGRDATTATPCRQNSATSQTDYAVRIAEVV